MTASPIRVGIVGLSPADPGPFRGGNWGVQHLRAINASPDYVITAVCNSSSKSARQALQVYNLSAAKAYGDPSNLANDPNVDMVVISVGPEHHYNAMKLALLKKKDVYVEFPVAMDNSERQELYQLAEENRCQIIVGAQATPDPALRKLHALIKDQTIGNVVLSSFTASLPFSTADGWPARMQGFLDVTTPISRSKGIFGHILCHHTHTLGAFQTVQSVFKVGEKTAITVTDGNEVADATALVTAPDTFALQGVLESGAVASLTLHVSRTPIDNVGYRWVISGTKGEVEFTAKPGVFQNANFGLSLKTRLWNEDTLELDMSREEPEWLKNLPDPAISLARVYDSFAKGDAEGYVSLKEGFQVHSLLDEIHSNCTWAP